MSKAKPKIAPYPFTTIHPLVGVLQYNDGFRVMLADIPGLIDGAACGRGRGHQFLRHLERTTALMYVVDAASVDGRDPSKDLEVLVQEISSYGDGDMMTRPAIVVANKVDLMAHDHIQEISFSLNKTATALGLNCDGEVHGISAGVTGEGLGILSNSLRSLIESGETGR